MEKYIIKNQSKKTLGKEVTLWIIFMLCILFALALYFRNNNQDVSTNKKGLETSFSLLPAGLIDENAKTTMYPHIVNKTDSEQTIVYSYTTNKPVADIINSFNAFLDRNKSWGSVIVDDKTKVKRVSAINTITRSSFLVSIDQGESTTSTNNITITYTEKLFKSSQAELLDNFPKEDGVSSEDNDFRDSIGNVTFTRTYMSKKSMDINYDRYYQYLKANGWQEMRNNANTDSEKILIMAKPGIGLKLNISKISKSSSKVTMSVIFTAQ